MNSFPVSVVITCYNYGRYLKSAIDSVLEQSLPVEEIIVIDDGSTDNTQAVLTRYKTNEKVSFVYQKNKGQAKAKNIGIQIARGAFVAFLDADDIWDPQKIEKQAPLFSNPDVGVVYTRQKFIDENNRVHSNAPVRLTPYRGRVVGEILKDNFIPFSSVIVRRTCFEKFGVFDEKLSMSIDWDLWLRCSLGTEFDYVDEDLLLYRLGHAGQMSKDAATREKCCDIIFENFIAQHEGELSKKEVRDARVYTYNNRAYACRTDDIGKALSYYRRSVMENPLQLKAYKGLLWSPFTYVFKKAVT